jgi:predicted glycosyltransferase
LKITARLWVDIDNPPQVQYLLPLAAAFERAGAEVLITARDDGITFALLRERGIQFRPIGKSFGKRKRQKALGLIRRTRSLISTVKLPRRPDALISSSRSSAMAARRLGLPSFILCDYEHADLRLYRLAGSYFVYPDVIGADAFTRIGIRPERLIPLPGLKEDLTFSGIEVDSVPAHRFDVAKSLVRVLFRPPAEETHYYESQSGRLALEVLGRLSSDATSIVIFAPRYSWQRRYLSQFNWVNPPVVLDDAVPFVPLLKAVDAVVSSGGTMLREAAWLGVPAYSIFRSSRGGVDRYLESLGRLTFISSPEDFERLHLTRLERRAPPMRRPRVAEQLVKDILDRLPESA